MKRDDWEMRRYVGIYEGNEIGERKKIFFYFFVGIMGERTPPGQGPHHSVMGNRLRLLRSAPGDKSRSLIYCIRFAYTHICLTSFLITNISGALLLLNYSQHMLHYNYRQGYALLMSAAKRTQYK